jgi:hypothetical protein
MHGKPPFSTLGTGSVPMRRNRLSHCCKAYYLDWDGNRRLQGGGGRTDYYSRFSCMGLFLAKNTLLTIFKRLELSENSSSNPFPTQTTPRK